MSIIAFPIPRFNAVERAAILAWSARRGGVNAAILATDDGREFASLEVGEGDDPTLHVLQREGRAVIVADARRNRIVARAQSVPEALEAFTRTLSVTATG